MVDDKINFRTGFHYIGGFYFLTLLEAKDATEFYFLHVRVAAYF